MLEKIATGGNGNLLTQTGADNPNTSTLYKQTTSDMSLANRATDPMLQGYATVTDALVKVNSALSKLPDSIYKTKGAFDAFSMSKPGSAVNGVLSTAVAVAGTIGTGMVIRSVFKKMAASTAAKAAAEAGGGAAKGKEAAGKERAAE